MAAAMGTISAMVITWVRFKKPDVSMTLNGSLAGLVAVTAGCATVSIAGAAIIGIIAGFAVVFGIEFVDKKLKVDDPVGAVGVHGVCGATGTILVGLFNTESGIISGFIYNDALTAGEAFKFFGVQLAGVVTVGLWAAVLLFALMWVLKKTMGIRADASFELQGLDLTEHALASAYADFAPSVPTILTTPADVDAVVPATEDEAVPVSVISSSSDGEPEPSFHGTWNASGGERSEWKPRQGGEGPKMSKVVIITNPSKFEILKNAMDTIGITGMTVTNVSGFGVQKGNSAEYYRGVKVDSRLAPKIKFEIVVVKVPVETVVRVAKKALYTGHYGDGKIFIYDVERVVKIRTGEEDFAALQDVQE
jgi:Amt family ammonium transporter